MIDWKPGAYIKTDDDFRWLADAEANGWVLGRKAAWPFRLWGIRFVRGGWLAWRVRRAAAEWGSVGLGFGQPNQRDLWVIYAIHRGWA